MLPRELMYTPEQVYEGAKALNAFHQATKAFPGVEDGLVVRHGDPKPRNLIYDGPDGGPVAFIDFDNASIGDAWSDLAWFAWTFATRASLKEQYPAQAQVASFQAAADGMSLTGESRSRLVEEVAHVQQDHLEKARRGVEENPTRHQLDNLNWLEQETAWMRELHRELRRAIGRTSTQVRGLSL